MASVHLFFILKRIVRKYSLSCIYGYIKLFVELGKGKAVKIGWFQKKNMDPNSNLARSNRERV